ncbi:MAG: hypothetical protein MUF38_04240 [Anaerolineae bacterium]|jgi:hypothetical protein|nr:hypothetical protein [Anaerolineae bacterium]
MFPYPRLLFLLGLVLALLTAPAAFAQEAAPRYRLTLIDGGITPDQCRVSFSVGVNNTGGISTETVQLVLSTTSGELAVITVPPVEVGRTPVFELSASLQGVAPGEQLFLIDVLNNGVEYGDTPALQQNLVIPQPPAACFTGNGADGSGSFFVTIPVFNIRIDLLNPTVDELAFLGGIALGVLLILLLPILLLRRLTRKPPTFGTQLPPYATIPPVDPGSEAGVRHGWQMAAQSNLLSAAPTPQAVGAVKLLVNADGQYLDGWTLTAVRLSQYDQYGRVSRSVTLADAGAVRALDKLAHDRKLLAMEDADRRAATVEKRVTPVARKLGDALAKRITERSAVLPIALDMRLRGEHGEVKIVFQLFRYEGGVWRELKSWEPEMVVTTGVIHESYTYTIHGQNQNESFKDYKRRLPLEIGRMLAEFVTPPESAGAPSLG